jgi:EmrB/QacA subfamily drug resistance transporter
MYKKLTHSSYYRWIVFSVVASGVFTSTLTSGIVNVALPSMIAYFKTDLTTVQWVVSAYLLIIIGLLPLAGRLGDLLGKRKIFSFGFIGFIIGSLLCGLAESIAMLIVARMIQAIGGAALMANSLAILSSTFPLQERGKAMGMLATVVAIGSMAGPSLGGLLVDTFGWNSIFIVNIPIGIIGFLGSRLILRDENRSRKESIDYIGAILFFLGMVSFLIVLCYGVQWGWGNWMIKVNTLLALLAFSVFVIYEKKIKHPMIDIGIFGNCSFVIGNISNVLCYAALCANVILLPFYLNTVVILTARSTGLVMSVFPIMMAIVSPFSGKMSDKMGVLVPIVAGFSLMSFGLYYTANLDVGVTLGSIIVGQAVIGLGNGLFQTPNNSRIMGAVHPIKLGTAGGINALSRYIGTVSGTIGAVSIFEYQRLVKLDGQSLFNSTQEINSFIEGYHSVLIIASILTAVGAIVSLTNINQKMSTRV